MYFNLNYKLLHYSYYINFQNQIAALLHFANFSITTPIIAI